MRKLSFKLVTHFSRNIWIDFSKNIRKSIELVNPSKALVPYLKKTPLVSLYWWTTAKCCTEVNGEDGEYLLISHVGPVQPAAQVQMNSGTAVVVSDCGYPGDEEFRWLLPAPALLTPEMAPLRTNPCSVSDRLCPLTGLPMTELMARMERYGIIVVILFKLFVSYN